MYLAEIEIIQGKKIPRTDAGAEGGELDRLLTELQTSS
jgi:hypothetical protein